MKLFHPEHARALRTFYEKEHETYTPLIESLASTLEQQVLPLSKGFDANAGGIAIARKAVFEQGLCRMPFHSDGGLSIPFGVYGIAMELTGAADAPTAMSVAIHNTVAEGLYAFGSEAQKESTFQDLISGRKLASFCLTEPSSGSDARAMRTSAVRRGSDYVIDGTKTFITNAGDADVYFVIARTEKGASAFLVDRFAQGLSIGSDIPKLGMRGSRTGEVRFEGCLVPAENMVGREGQGFEYVKAMLSGSRIIMGSICVGIALTAYDKALAYVRERRLFDQKLSDMQMTREKVANMRLDISSARVMCMYASRLKEDGDAHYASEAAQAKILATEMAARVCDNVIQLFGGYGYTDSDIHRHWRDARLLTIGEGASEVLRMLIAGKELGRVKMNIAVCVKHSIDEGELRADSSGRPQLQGAMTKMATFDRNAVEEAVRIKESRGGSITVLTLGTQDSKKTLKEALAMGCDRGLLLVPAPNAELDTLATSYFLSRALQNAGPFDLVLLAEGSSDTYDGLVGPMVAEWGGLPFVGYARKIDVGDGVIKAEVTFEDRAAQVEVGLPAMLSVVSEINTPRFPTLLQIMQASKKPIQEVQLDSLRDDRSPKTATKVSDIVAQSVNRKKVIFEGAADETAQRLLEALRKEGVI